VLLDSSRNIRPNLSVFDMQIMKMLFSLTFAGNFHQRRRFHGYHDQRIADNTSQDYIESEMLGQEMNKAVISPELQSLIDSMITDRRKVSIDNFTAWNLYKQNLNR